MINSVNALEFLKPELIKMDKFNSTTATKILSQPSSRSQTRTFVTVSGHPHNHFNHHNNAIDSQQLHQQFILSGDEKERQNERVKVQHLENHSKLQNNKCRNNLRTLYNNVSASSNAINSAVKNRETFKIRQTKDDNEIDVVNIEYLPNNNVQQNKSAFNLDFNNKKYYNNNSFCGNNNFQEELPPSPVYNQRTEDQNIACRHIESVHNYAKSKSYQDNDSDNLSPNDSRHSSYIDDDEEDDDDDDDVEDNDIEARCNYDHNVHYDESLEGDDLDDDYENYFRRRRYSRFQKLSTDVGLTTRPYSIINSKLEDNVQPQKLSKFISESKIQIVESSNKGKAGNEDEEIHVDVDVETVESQSFASLPTIPVMNSSATATVCNISNESAVKCSKPDHHARRPMNAFLIFCKRHRAIVKERYKNLENRAITKILGDWWASLDISDKKCFTNLAQQNKDVFFSANPNFKWYKLPAPPLRTLTTRPNNIVGQEHPNDNECSNGLDIISNNTSSSNSNHSNYFKLADEAEMGDLSQLMQHKSKANREHSGDLHQALGETSQFMSAHITCHAETIEDHPLKRRFYHDNSFSSNSSEDDGLEPKKKSTRSCKGKRYQELINSGQIVTAAKKYKTSPTSLGTVFGGEDNLKSNDNKQNFLNANIFNNHLKNASKKYFISECENMTTNDLNGFDLEERIKELPALNLDEYLLRKRNTKKKKKVSSNGKKRGPRSYNSATTTISKDYNNSNIGLRTTNELQQLQQILGKDHQQPTTAVVGSQKRKARKESITRRDVSSIEQEVASLLPLTINGCRYFQEASAASKYNSAIEKDTKATQQSLIVTLTSPIIPLQQQVTSSSISDNISNNSHINNNKNDNLNDSISSSTSDLLILAEVAANRTELKH